MTSRPVDQEEDCFFSSFVSTLFCWSRRNSYLLRAFEFAYIDFGYIVSLPTLTLFFFIPQSMLFVYSDSCSPFFHCGTYGRLFSP